MDDEPRIAIAADVHRRLVAFAEQYDLGPIEALVSDVLATWLDEQEDAQDSDADQGGPTDLEGGGFGLPSKRAVKTSPD